MWYCTRHRAAYTNKFLLAFPVDPEYKPIVHDAIFSLIYYSEGAFTFGDVYEMPVYLRKFYTDKLVEARKRENEQVKKATSTSRPNIQRPG